MPVRIATLVEPQPYYSVRLLNVDFEPITIWALVRKDLTAYWSKCEVSATAVHCEIWNGLDGYGIQRLDNQAVVVPGIEMKLHLEPWSPVWLSG